MASFSSSLIKELKNSPMKHEAELMYSTTKLVLSQVKLLLDRNML
jgi:hypothetical protein